MPPDDLTATVIQFPAERTKRARDDVAVVEAIEPGQALVPFGATAAAGSHAETRRDSAFIAQLIAAKVQAPQARVRRRAAPGEAAQAYQLSLEAAHRTGDMFTRNS